MIRRISLPLTGAALLLSGCMVGPKYVKPTAPIAPAFKENSGWQLAQPADTKLRGDWWTIFGDEQLNALEPQIALSNQTAKVAEARFREARAQIQFNRSNLAPTIGFGPNGGGLRQSTNRPYAGTGANPNGVSDIQLPIDLSYEVDVWGRIRHGISAAREEATASAGDLATAVLSLQSELAIDYFEARAADASAKLLSDTVKDYEEADRITTNRFNGGVAPQSDVDQARTQLEAARVQESDVEIIRDQFEHAIAVLIGKPPASFTLAVTPLKLQPPPIPITLPADLLQRRPDIASAERRVAEANDQVGIAAAAYYPTLSFNAALGVESTAFSNLLKASSLLWSAGPGVSETFFDFGRRHSVMEQSKANYDATVATYRQTTLTAFQQVEDSLTVLRVLQSEADQQHRATEAAQRAQAIFNNRYVGGLDTYLQVVTAQQAALANERNDIDIERRQMDASVLLIKALGGGWDTTQLPKL